MRHTIYNIFIALIVGLGAIFLSMGLFYVCHIIRQLKKAETRRWFVLFGLIVFFIVGYCVFAITVFYLPHTHLLSLIAAVFFFGGLFVYLTTQLSEGTIKNIKQILVLKFYADRDALTRLYNRRYFMQALTMLLQRISRGAPPSVLLFLDLNKFKCINDTYGHLKGDVVLKRVAKILRSKTRRSDVVARYGGDEFVVLLFNIKINEGKVLAEKLHHDIMVYTKKNFKRCKSLGCSIGATVVDQRSSSAKAVLTLADEACYSAKRDKHVSVYTHRA